MRLEEARDLYYEASANSSAIARQLALASVGIFWILSGGIGKDHVLHAPGSLIVSLICGIAALAVDLLQYLWRTFAFWWWSSSAQRKCDENGLSPAEADEKELGSVPTWINPVSWALWDVKIVALLISYALIGAYLINRLAVN